MVNKDWRFSDHARYESWENRFSEYDIKDAINRSLPWGGGQRGNDTLYYDDVSNAVFVVADDGWVKTVLTRELAIANLQSRVGFTRSLDFSKPRVKLEPVKEEIEFSPPSSVHKDVSIGGKLDQKCFDCAKYILTNFTKEQFESNTKFMCGVTKKALRLYGLKSKQYSYEWGRVNQLLYQLWAGKIETYNDVTKQPVGMQ